MDLWYEDVLILEFVLYLYYNTVYTYALFDLQVPWLMTNAWPSGWNWSLPLVWSWASQAVATSRGSIDILNECELFQSKANI